MTLKWLFPKKKKVHQKFQNNFLTFYTLKCINIIFTCDFIWFPLKNEWIKFNVRIFFDVHGFLMFFLVWLQNKVNVFKNVNEILLQSLYFFLLNVLGFQFILIGRFFFF